jgi:hypothetical protein
MHFTHSKDDLEIDLMAVGSAEWRDVRRDDRVKVSSCAADLRKPQNGEDPDLGNVRNDSVRRLSDWLSDSCRRNCKFGMCRGQTCICDDEHSGKLCDVRQASWRRFESFLGFATIASTVMFLGSGLVAWFAILKDGVLFKKMWTVKSTP